MKEINFDSIINIDKIVPGSTERLDSINFDNINATNYPIYLRTTKFKIGYVPQHGGYFHDLTLIENLKAISEVLVPDEKERLFKTYTKNEL